MSLRSGQAGSADNTTPHIEVQTTSQNVLYLENVVLAITVRNPFDYPITMTKITCVLHTDPGFAAYKPSRSLRETIPPHKKSARIKMEFEADLSFQQWTNEIQVELEWTGLMPGRVTAPAGSYLIFRPLDPPNRTVFISHKDPENVASADTLRDLLKKIGCLGYLAREDKKPGTDMWAKKIPNALEVSCCVVMLWTVEASKHPASLRREFDLASSKGKYIILAVENGATVPTNFPSTVEYFPMPSPLSSDAMKELVVCIFRLMEEGTII